MFWEDPFDGLNEIFMIGVKLVFSDEHKKIPEAVRQSFLESS
jgi:hypothetical protein